MQNTERKILIADDDPQIRKMLEYILKSGGYKNIISAASCADAELFVKIHSRHIMILDIMFPDGDGFSLLNKIRQTSGAPALFLSARDEDNSRLRGLGLGADDYITKPFNGDELILRLTNILRRVYRDEDDILNLGDRQINWGSGQITGPEGEISLTAKEYAILKKLAENRGRIVTIDGLCDAVWKDGNFGHENALMVYIRRLREKLEDNPSKPKWIITSRGLGYKLAKE